MRENIGISAPKILDLHSLLFYDPPFPELKRI